MRPYLPNSRTQILCSECSFPCPQTYHCRLSDCNLINSNALTVACYILFSSCLLTNILFALLCLSCPIAVSLCASIGQTILQHAVAVQDHIRQRTIGADSAERPSTKKGQFLGLGDYSSAGQLDQPTHTPSALHAQLNTCNRIYIRSANS